MRERRVVITGVGVVSALGLDKEVYFQDLWEGANGVDRIKAFDASEFPSQVGGEIGDLKINQFVPKAQRKAAKLMSRDIQLAVAAADAAIRDARLKTKGTCPEEEAQINPERSGVNIGAGLICCDLVELGAAVEHAIEDGAFNYQKWGSEGMETLTPLWLLKYLPNMLSCHISIIHDLQGPSNSITCGEVSGLLSIGEAYRHIATDKADIIIAGGAECKVNPMGLLRQCLMNRVSTHYNDKPKQACRPFDKGADGSVVGEGAGILVLEEKERALSRGAPIYGEITGFGASNNFSSDMIEPEPQGKGITIAITKALGQAGLGPEEVDLLIPHGLAVAGQDRAEAEGIRGAFGAYSSKLPVFATKSSIGNCGAGASAIDLATAILALNKNMIPATVNCPNPLEEYGLNVVNTKGMEKELRKVMSCCYTFGGQTAAMVISK